MKRHGGLRNVLLPLLFLLPGLAGTPHLRGAEVILRFEKDGRLAAEASPRGTGPRTQDRDVRALTAAVPDPRVLGIPMQRVRGRVVSRDGAATYDLSGESLGGRFNLRG